MTKTLFQRLDQPLHQLIAEEAIEGKIPLIAVRRAIIKLSDSIRGASRRQMPSASRWAEIIVGLDDLAKRCPAELRTALQEAKLEACGQMKALVTDPKDAGRASARPVVYARSLVARESAPNRGRVAPVAPTKRTPTKPTRTPSAPRRKASPDFYVQTGRLTVKKADAERPIIAGTASSTAVDLDQERFSLTAMQDMAKAFPGMTAFFNHKYSVPADVAGRIKTTKLTRRGQDIDLDITLEMTLATQAARETYALIEEGTKLGISVGVLVNDYHHVREGDRKILEITRVEPIEASLVGVPSNRRSWVQQATASIKRKAAKIGGNGKGQKASVEGSYRRLYGPSVAHSYEKLYGERP